MAVRGHLCLSYVDSSDLKLLVWDFLGGPVVLRLPAPNAGGLGSTLHNWTAQRCSWSYTEKRRRRKETEVAMRIKGGNEKERDRSSQ